MSVDKKNTKATPDDIEALKAKLAEFEAAKGGKSDPDNFEIRLTRSQAKNVELADSLRGLTATISDMEADNKARELKAAESSGDFKSIVQLKDGEIQSLQSELDNSKLDVTRLTIGRKNNLPDEIAKLLPGTNSDEIEANAITIRASMKATKGFSDARQSGGVVVTGNGPKKPKSQYIAVKPEGAF